MVMQKQSMRSILAAALALLVMSTITEPVYATGYDDNSRSGSPEYLYHIEGTGTYFLPGGEVDVFFNLGNWYRRSEGSWSVSAQFGGPWGGLRVESVPRSLIDLPPDFRSTRRMGMIPYGYVVGPDRRDNNHGDRYYRGEYYDDYERHGYRRRWNSRGGFWFFVAPDFHDNRRDFHDDDRDDNHRGRGRRGRGRDRH